MKMMVRDVMSVRMICAREETPIKELAEVMVRNRIGGLPVVDDQGHVKGIVSETDLQPVKEGVPLARSTARDVMKRPVITLTEGDSITQAARVLKRHRVKRAPVVREGRVVGMVTQSDLLRPYLRTDSEIRTDVEEALLEDGLIGGADVSVRVHQGVVMLNGTVRSPRQAALISRVARTVDGALDVRDLTVVADREAS